MTTAIKEFVEGWVKIESGKQVMDSRRSTVLRLLGGPGAYRYGNHVLIVTRAPNGGLTIAVSELSDASGVL